jgi:signal transduction histidine kinase
MKKNDFYFQRISRARKTLLRLVLAKRSAFNNYLSAFFLALIALFLSLVAFYSGLEGIFFPPLIAVVLAASFGGIGPSIFAAFIGAIGLDLLFFEAEFAFFSTYVLIRLVGYLFTAILCGSIVSQLREGYIESDALRAIAQKAENQAQESKNVSEKEAEARKKIVHVVSHDLRNPLAALTLNIELLESGVFEEQNDEEKEVFLRSMRRSLARMKRIVDDLLDAKKIESGSFSINLQPNNLEDVIQDCLLELQSQRSKKNIAILTDINPELPPLLIDQDRITQAIGNLLDNAIKHSPKNGKVWVSASKENAKVLLTIRDEGPGIPKDLTHRLFQPYQTSHQKPSGSPEGTGLGLYIAKAITRSHGGDLTFKNIPNKGVEFQLILPQQISKAA